MLRNLEKIQKEKEGEILWKKLGWLRTYIGIRKGKIVLSIINISLSLSLVLPLIYEPTLFPTPYLTPRWA